MFPGSWQQFKNLNISPNPAAFQQVSLQVCLMHKSALAVWESRPLCFPVKPSGTSISGNNKPLHERLIPFSELTEPCGSQMSFQTWRLSLGPRLAGWLWEYSLSCLGLFYVYIFKRKITVSTQSQDGAQGKGKKVLCKTPVPWLRTRRQCLLRLVGYRKSISNKKIRNSHPKESGLTCLPVSFKANYVMLGARKTVQSIGVWFTLQAWGPELGPQNPHF